jgi:hypothetical protein
MNTRHPDDLPTLTVPAIYPRSDSALQETVDRLTRELAASDAENKRLRRELGTARLLADLRRDIAEFELSGDELPALLRPQA